MCSANYESWLTFVKTPLLSPSFVRCAMTRSNVCHDSFTCVQWLFHTSNFCQDPGLISFLWYLSVSLSFLMDVCEFRVMAHFCQDPARISLLCTVWYDVFACVPWLIHTCAMTHSHVCHDSFTRVPWLIHMCAMTLSYVKLCQDPAFISLLCNLYVFPDLWTWRELEVMAYFWHDRKSWLTSDMIPPLSSSSLHHDMTHSYV